ncbi:MAG: hypothetical protein ACIALR_06815 [Blastopirellula sp. JB062]
MKENFDGFCYAGPENAQRAIEEAHLAVVEELQIRLEEATDQAEREEIEAAIADAIDEKKRVLRQLTSQAKRATNSKSL